MASRTATLVMRQPDGGLDAAERTRRKQALPAAAELIEAGLREVDAARRPLGRMRINTGRRPGSLRWCTAGAGGLHPGRADLLLHRIGWSVAGLRRAGVMRSYCRPAEQTWQA
jgi:hypothetical protein